MPRSEVWQSPNHQIYFHCAHCMMATHLTKTATAPYSGLRVQAPAAHRQDAHGEVLICYPPIWHLPVGGNVSPAC